MNDQETLDELQDLKDNPLILIISEDQKLTQELTKQLESANFDCVLAKNKEEMLTKATQLLPACIVLDSSYMALDTLQEYFKTDAKLQNTPILITSADQNPPDVTNDNIDFIKKPINKELFLHQLKTLIKVSTLQKNYQQSLRGKDDFLYIVSHDLKNPLGVISSCADLLVEDSDELSKTHLDLAQRTKRNVRFCIDLVSNILDVARLEGGLKLNLASFKVKDLLLSSKDTIQLFAEQKGINLVMECQENLAVLADLNKMQQVVNNITGNSVKYTPKDGTIKVKAFSFTDDNYDSLQLKIEISDTGMGIPANKIDSIFERMEQARDTDQNIGTGLGLFICKNICELHKGKIWVESVEEQGTTFHIVLPGAVIKEMPQEEKTPKADDLEDILSDFDESEIINLEEKAPQSMLIIDDSEDLFALFKIFLQKYPVEIEYADTGPAGIEMVKNNLYDIIFCDINLPGLTGPKIVKIIRDWEKSQSLPPTQIIAMSVAKGGDDLQKYLDLDFSGFLEKPISKNSVTETMSKHLEDFVIMPGL